MDFKNCLVIGQTGAGKSTFLNDVFGSDWETKRSGESCTQVTSFFESTLNGEKIRVWDCPGCFDGERSLQDWAQEVLQKTDGKKFSQIWFVVNATTRAGTLDTLLCICLRFLMTNFKMEECVTVVFTHCDAAPELYEVEARAKWVDALNKKCKFEERNLPKIDRDKTLAFTKKENLQRKDLVADLAEKWGQPELKEKSGAEVFKKLVSIGAKVIAKPLFETTPFNAKQIGLDAGREILKEVVHTCGKDTADEYLECYDAATTYVTKFNPLTQRAERVRAVSVEPGDQILGEALVPEEVIIKNVQHPKCAVMRAITVATEDGRSSCVTLSYGHYVPMRQSGTSISKLVPSRNLQIGDVLQTSTEEGSLELSRIISIEDALVQTTVNLRTRSLTLVVNGIVGSSRAEGDAGIVGHWLVLLANVLFNGGGQKLQDLAWAVEARLRVTPLLRKFSMLLT